MKRATEKPLTPQAARTNGKRRTVGAIVFGSAGAFGMRAVLKRRNASLHAVTTALEDTVSAPAPVADTHLAGSAGPPAHAPGHRHLEPDPARTSPRLAHRAWRRWAPRADHTGHPPRV